MKGVIVNCLAELVVNKFGRDKWEASLEKAGLDPQLRVLSIQDVDDAAVLKVVESVCDVVGITSAQAADAFGDYWVNEFAPRIYQPYYTGMKTAKDFLLNMDRVHEAATRSIANARPPRFTYEWKDGRTLIMTYHSHRGLVDFLVGLVRGVGRHFNERLTVTRLGADKVQVVFAS